MRIVRILALQMFFCVATSAFGQAGMAEYALCFEGSEWETNSSRIQSRIFACSKVAADSSLPEDIRSRALMFRGLSYQNAKDFDRSMEDFRQALRLNPQNADAYFYRGTTHVHVKNDYPRSIPDYLEALRVNPQHREARRSLAWSYAKTGQIDLSVREYEAVVAATPDYAWGHFGLSCVLARKNDAARSADHRRRAEVLDPAIRGKAC